MIKNNFCLVGVDRDFENLIYENNGFFLGYLTDFKSKRYKSSNKVLGKERLSDWIKIKKKFNPDVFIVIDEGKTRESLKKKIFKSNVKNLVMYKTEIDAKVLKNFKNKKGIIIQKNCFISSNVTIEEGVKIHVGSQIHHDVVIKKYVTIAPSSIILGKVKIDNYSYIGANSTIKQGVNIGKNSIVGAGSVVIRDVKDYEVVAGNPARRI